VFTARQQTFADVLMIFSLDH